MLKRIPSEWFLAGTVLALLSFAFVWLWVRPVQVKKDCSWLTYTEPAKEAFAGITQEQADRTNSESARSNPVECATATGLNRLEVELSGACKPINEKAQAPRPAEPARKVKRQATKPEYEQCLRNYGLF